MTLIRSISGIRGIIGGKPGDGLSPLGIVKFTALYARWYRGIIGKKQPLVVVGRDARILGGMVESLACATLCGMEKCIYSFS